MSPNDWKEYALYDLADYRNGKAFRSTELADGGTPVIKIAELNRGINEATLYYPGTVDEKHQINRGDLLFAWSASVGVYRWEDGQAALNQHIFKVEPKSFIGRDFLRYLLTAQLPRFRRLVDDHATTMGHVKVADLKRMTAAVPPPEGQERIVAVLLPLDDKASVNRQIATRAEAISDEVFRRRFLDFTEEHDLADSEIGPIPFGWSVASLADLAEFVNGKAFTKNATGTGRMVVRIAELNAGPGPATVYNDIEVDEKQRLAGAAWATPPARPVRRRTHRGTGATGLGRRGTAPAGRRGSR